jgi:hypothetical protein
MKVPVNEATQIASAALRKAGAARAMADATAAALVAAEMEGLKKAPPASSMPAAASRSWPPRSP